MGLRPRLFFFLAVVLAVYNAHAGTAQRSANGQQVFTGEIMDSYCAANGSHKELMDQMKSMGRVNRTCTLKCLELGAKLVFYDASQQATYTLGNTASRAFPFMGKKVRITGTLHKHQLTIDTIDQIP